MARRSITFPSQCRELTLVRQDDPVWVREHRSLAVATLKRVDPALQAFFRRVKAGVNGGGKVGHVGGLIVGLRRTSTTQWYVLPPPLTRHTPTIRHTLAIRENAPTIPSEYL